MFQKQQLPPSCGRSGVKQAAEKGQDLAEISEINTAGAKARFIFHLLTTRLKSCPDASCSPQ
jgi:hypothetical protein